ncbi:MAG: tetratricopeptide repeat protein [Cypionkella sp.]
MLRVPDKRPSYDLRRAFDLIGKNRLAAIWADSDTGDLRFGIACSCYAMPFEFRPGVVVIDLRDGKPPKGSSFETPLDDPGQSADPALSPDGASAQSPHSLAYDWTGLTSDHLRAVTSAPMDAALSGLQASGLQVDPALEALRTSLMEEMSRGASQGIVEMARPKSQPEPIMGKPDPSVQIHLGETPNLVIRQKGAGDVPRTAKGALCISDDQLDLPAWGSNRPVSDQIGPERQGLTGEFDRPDPDAVTRAIRFQLFLGFGVEARGLTRAFPEELPDKAIWNSMARILDDISDPAPSFTGMQDCSSAAALWAVLADPIVRPTSDVGKSAILRNFSVLPAHLRRLLGPRLVESFLSAGDIPVATSLRDAVLRAPGDPGPGIVLMQAALDRALGDTGKSEAQLVPLASSAGPSSGDALVALVEQRAALGQSVDFDQVQALEGYLKEREGSADAARYRHALIVSRAASGDFDRAFADAPESPDTLALLWQILAQSGPDSALLVHATLADLAAAPPQAKASAATIADRMLGLGLAGQAAGWLKLDDEAPALLAARITLARGDPRGALHLLQAKQSDAALTIKAEAFQAMNDEKGAAEIFARLGKTDEQWQAISRLQAWDVLARGGPDAWKAVASIIVSRDAEDGNAATLRTGPEGVLAHNKALVEGSAATRDAITTLLKSVRAPSPATQ